jgi:hypothetical protein
MPVEEPSAVFAAMQNENSGSVARPRQHSVFCSARVLRRGRGCRARRGMRAGFARKLCVHCNKAHVVR